MRLAGYVRVSRVGGRGGDSFISPAVQREQIVGYAAARGFDVVEWHEDLDESGGRMSRPAFDRMMMRVEAGETDGVIVAKLDRFARTVAGAYAAIKRLEDAGAQLVSVADSLDTTTPVGRFARTMMLAIAELERDRIRDSWQAARSHAVGRGVHISTRPPTGYQRGESSVLEPNGDAAAVLRAFEMRAGGASNSEIAAMLVSRGVVGSHGSPGWSPAAVSRLLRNRAYLGEARSGDLHNPDAHPAVVPVAVWEAAQRRRGVRPLRSDDGFLLAGLVRCAGCRYRMAGSNTTSRGRRSPLYRCKKHHPSGMCDESAVMIAARLEGYVIAEFERAIQPGGIIFDAAQVTVDLAAAEERVAVADVDVSEYRDDAEILRALGRDRFVEGLDKRMRRLNEAKAALAEERARSAPAVTLDMLSAGDVWDAASIPERRQILHAAIDCIFLRGGRSLPVADRVMIYWRGDGPTDLPRRGSPAEIRPFAWPDAPSGSRMPLGQ